MKIVLDDKLNKDIKEGIIIGIEAGIVSAIVFGVIAGALGGTTIELEEGVLYGMLFGTIMGFVLGITVEPEISIVIGIESGIITGVATVFLSQLIALLSNNSEFMMFDFIGSLVVLIIGIFGSLIIYTRVGDVKKLKYKGNFNNETKIKN